MLPLRAELGTARTRPMSRDQARLPQQVRVGSPRPANLPAGPVSRSALPGRGLRDRDCDQDTSQRAGHGEMVMQCVYLLARRVLSLGFLVFRGDMAKDAESLVLWHENAVLLRHVGRMRYEPADRAWFAAASQSARLRSTRTPSGGQPGSAQMPGNPPAWAAPPCPRRPHAAASSVTIGDRPLARPRRGNRLVGVPRDAGRDRRDLCISVDA
jgi:hypothetical protein